MNLELGRIAFTASSAARGRERRFRQKKLEAHEAAKRGGSFESLKEVPSKGAKGDVPSRIAEVSILPDTWAPRDVSFRVGATRDRMGGSFAASLGSHAVGIGLLFLLVSLAPERVFKLVELNRNNYDGIVWIPEDGPGGGGGGGGNESLELPRPVEVEGPDETELDIPIEPEIKLEPEVEPEPVDLLRLNIPALSMAAALETLPGSMDDILAARDSLSQGRGSLGGAETGTGRGIGPGEGSGLGPGKGGGVGGGVYRPGSGIENPQPLYRAKPQYTSEAMRAQVQGEVWLEIVVLPDGTVGDVTITRSLDRVFGLDEEAIKAAWQWRFKPGMRFGKPVAVMVGIALEFHLR